MCCRFGKLRLIGLAVPIAASLAAGGIASAQTAAPIEVAIARKGPLESNLELAGSVTAERRASLSARTAGLVTRVHVDAGSRVNEGDVLLEFDPAMARLAVQRAGEALREAASDLAESTRLFAEGQTLVKSGGIPKTEAEARRSALSKQQAVVNQLQITLKEREEVLDRHRLLAPFPGVVSAKMAEEGEWVETGVPVLDLVEVDAVRFDTQAPQESYVRLDAATPATVEFDSRPETDFPAKIIAKVPVKDRASRTFLVRLSVDAPRAVMVPGSSGRAKFRVRLEKSAVTVPRDAIVRQPDGGAIVWVVEDGEGALRAAQRPVRIGGGMMENVEIIEGIEDGQRVVVRGNESLREGQEVAIVNALKES